MCWDCKLARGFRDDKEAAAARTRRDWEQTPDPIRGDGVKLGALPANQYEGVARSAIRAFRDAEDASAVVDGVSSGTLNASIASLGLEAEMYAEIRDEKVVLRRVAAPTRKGKAAAS